jgi:urease alpha subunit
MKNLKVYAALLLFISFFSTSCSPDHDFVSSTDEIITRGSWDVEFFVNDNKTAEFKNYNLEFGGNGKLLANNGTTIVEGKWTLIRDVDRTDLLTINLNERDNVGQLSNVWSVTEKSLNAFKFQAKGNTTELRLRKL